MGGPLGALIGLGFGALNTLAGVVVPSWKYSLYSGFQNLLDDTYDTIANTDVGKSIYDAKETVKKEVGKAIKGTWDSVSNWFRGGVEYGW